MAKWIVMILGNWTLKMSILMWIMGQFENCKKCNWNLNRYDRYCQTTFSLYPKTAYPKTKDDFFTTVI